MGATPGQYVSKTDMGREYVVVGNRDLFGKSDLEVAQAHLDEDVRISSVSLLPTVSPSNHGMWERGTAPTGLAVLVALDGQDLVGPVALDNLDSFLEWCARASARGLPARLPQSASATTAAPCRIGLPGSKSVPRPFLRPSSAFSRVQNQSSACSSPPTSQWTRASTSQAVQTPRESTG